MRLRLLCSSQVELDMAPCYKVIINVERIRQHPKLLGHEKGRRRSLRASLPGQKKDRQLNIRPEEGSNDGNEIKIKGKRIELNPYSRLPQRLIHHQVQISLL